MNGERLIILLVGILIGMKIDFLVRKIVKEANDE